MSDATRQRALFEEVFEKPVVASSLGSSGALTVEPCYWERSTGGSA